MKHTGILPIPTTTELFLQITGGISTTTTASFASRLPPVFKRGNTVQVKVHVVVPTTAPMSVVDGNITLARKLPKGTVTEVWRADALPVELTFSSIPLPPDPGEEGKASVEGVITNPYKVRDDILRAIIFTYPTSEPIRNAFIQYSQADQKMAVDYLALQGNPTEQKRVVRLGAKMRAKGQSCVSHVFGVNELSRFALDEKLARHGVINDARHAIDLVFLNTKERARIYVKTDALLGGDDGGFSRRPAAPGRLRAVVRAAHS